MEILTLLKASLRKKKSTYISILLMTAMIVATMLSILSVRNNYDRALTAAMEYADCGDIRAFIHTSRLTEEVKESVEESELVERVEYTPALVVSNGQRVGEMRDGNTYFMTEVPEKLRLFKEEANGYKDTIPSLGSGEIYLPLGLSSKLECEVGDTFVMELIGGEPQEFRIKGFVEEPAQGALTIGWKQVFISNEDYEKFYAEYKPLENANNMYDFTMLRIHQPDDSKLSAAKFQRQLNLETKIVDMGLGALNTEQSIRYSTLLPDVVTNIVLVFSFFLLMIVLIVMSHSISTEIEIDYVTFGILKSQGFSKEKIRFIIMLQYLLAQMAGIVAGCLLALPIAQVLGSLCQNVTGILPYKGLDYPKGILICLIILVASMLLLWVKTRRIAAISPVRAISGGRDTIYFDSRVQLPISKKLLLSSISLRQFTSAKRRYVGIVLIAAILTFSMLTVNLVGNLLSSRSALSAMGMPIPDIEMYLEASVDGKEVDELVEKQSDIREKNAIVHEYASLNGENLLCQIYQYPESINGILEGRAPLYDNEILITEMVADMLDIKLGDEVTVSLKKQDETCIVSGIFQSGNDSGTTFAMNFDCAKRLGSNLQSVYRYYILEDKSKLYSIVDELVERYGDSLEITVYEEDENPVTGEYDGIVAALTLLIYAFSILFAFVVVRMICTKSFIQERTDIGIYKAMGFTSNRLRISFAIRFLIVALFGAGIGVVLSVLFSARMMSLLLSLIGLTQVVLEYTMLSLLVPTVAICMSFFVFAYLAAGKIKRVEVRELVVE